MSPANRQARPAAFLVRLGHRIAELRKARGLAQAHLAEAVGVAVESISRIERAAAVPSLALLAKIAEALEIEVEQLFRPSGAAPRPHLEPEIARLVALIRSKPPGVQRDVLRLVTMFLSRR